MLKIKAFILVAAAIALMLYLHEIVKGRFPMRCPFFAITGLKCMGCGGQRAVHCLLAGDVQMAMSHNALILFYPAYILGLLIDPLYRSRCFLYGGLFLMIAFVIIRNIVGI